MTPLGHPTYLAAKAKGENSMWEKRRPHRRRLVKRSARPVRYGESLIA